MESLKELFRIGIGPSSTHTMAARRASQLFLARHPDAARYRVTLFGSLAATGKGHLTDLAVTGVFGSRPCEIANEFKELPKHPNGMEFEAFDARGIRMGFWRVYSIGGGALREEDEKNGLKETYDLPSMDALLEWATSTGKPLWQYVDEREGPLIWEYLDGVWQTMSAAIENGLEAEGVLPGGLNLPRKARSFWLKAKRAEIHVQRTGLVSAYALAVAEENAGGGEIVTAPSCGSAGVLPAVLRYIGETYAVPERRLIRGLATAGLVGNFVKENASIAGAEVGCQGEIGTACAMASAAVTQLLGGTARQIEYAAEMGLEHHLGLTCDPVRGLVQIPCIERNAFGATRAIDCANYALLSDGIHSISFDDVVRVMKETGHDLASSYRETGRGGLALVRKFNQPSG
jgi:L-serine dehydratase